MSQSPVGVSIVVPAHNEQDSLRPLHDEIRAAMGRTAWIWELVVVDDASTDHTAAVLRDLAAADPRVRVFRHRRNAGQSAALVAGLRRARGERIVTLDADLQNDPADIPRLLDALRDCDVVSGIRVKRQDDWMRRVSSRIANAVRRRVTGDRITDIGCSLKAYRARFVRDLPAFDGVHRFLPALAQHRGARVRELAVNHRPRRHGVAKYNIRNRLWRALRDLFGVRWLQSRWIDPDNVVDEGASAAPPRTERDERTVDRVTSGDRCPGARVPGELAPRQPAARVPGTSARSSNG